ncbi:MAG: methyltransferase domain-containing protein [Bacteroidota bacterium]
MIDRKHINLIIAIDKSGSLNKASKELNLTQSALSHQLKNLEDYLGLEIFHRRGNKLFFTEAGYELKEKAEKISIDLKELESRLLEIKEKQYSRYVHGYSEREAKRLIDQATTVADFLHYDSVWDKGSQILEIGCGVGAQTAIIAMKNPESHITAIDISKESVEKAREEIKRQGIQNVDFQIQDIRQFTVDREKLFDHIFICFLLEHLKRPVDILKRIKKILKPNGTITVIEGDHGSSLFYPENMFSRKVIEAQVQLQKLRGGNANIGRELYPLLSKAGYREIEVSPRQIYVDETKPTLVNGFIKNTFTAMIQGMSKEMISEGIISMKDADKGIDGLLKTTEKNGVFSYTFFKAKGKL